MSEDTLILVKFQGYCLQIRMALGSQIFEVVQILRENEFVPQSIQNQYLQFRKKNNKIIRGGEKVQSLIQPGENKSSCQLLIQINDSPVRDAPQRSQQNQDLRSSNNLLSKVVTLLNKNDFDTLLNIRQNMRIGQETREHLFAIGQIFRNLSMKKLFFERSLEIMGKILQKQEAQHEFEQNCETYGDFINETEINEAKKVFQQIQIIMQKIQTSKNEKIVLQDNFIEQRQKNIRYAKAQSNYKTEIQKLQGELVTKTLQIDKLVNQNIQLKEKQNSSNQNFNIEITKLKENIQKLQKKQLLLTTEKKDVKSKVQMLISAQKQLQKNITILKEQLSMKDKQLQSKDKEITKLKQQLGGEQIIQYLKRFCRPTSISTSLVLTLQKILGDNVQLAKQLKEIITKQMKLSILSITQLFSFDHQVHQGYSFKGTFGKLIENRRSILFVGRSKSEDKVFGAFTQEKYQFDPENYQITDFNGCSFLFTSINQKIQYFKYIPGENSILYDPNSLVFGNDDLVLEFDKNKCRSKFAQRRSVIFEINNQNQIYKNLISDLPNPKAECDIGQYAVYEVQFNEKK